MVPLEEGAVQPQALQVLVLHHRSQLLVIPKENHLEGQTGSVLTAHGRRHPPTPLPSVRSLHPRGEATPSDLLSLGEVHQGDEGLGLRGHARLVHEDLPDVQVLERGRGRTRACAQDDAVLV